MAGLITTIAAATLAPAAMAALLLAALRTCGVPVTRIARRIRAVAARPRLSFLLLASLCVALRLALLPVFPVPRPGIHDEFSNLLAADTFLSGRLSNPPHPLWRHFDTNIVLQHPTYSSYRPPGQGLWLALGQLIFGSPWPAILVASALLCAALYWALSGWIPRMWAFVAGLLAVFNIGLLSYWTNSYWGGSLTGLGGALVLGATGRMLRALEGGGAAMAASGLWFAIGLIPLMLTRPYEGAALVLGCAIALAPGLWRNRGNLTSIALAALPVIITACALLGWMAFYNYRVTGSPLRSPYMIGMNEYHGAGVFIWDTKFHPRTWSSPDIARFSLEFEGEQLKSLDSVRGKLLHVAQVLGLALAFFIRPLLLAPLLVYSWKIFRSRRMRPALIAGIPALVAAVLAIWIMPHYDAAATALIYLLIIQALRYVWALRMGSARFGRHAAAALVLTAIISPFSTRLVNHFSAHPFAASSLSWCCVGREPPPRFAIEKQLDNAPGVHLVLIHYPADFNIHDQWVYNAADIDHSHIVWARSLGEASDRRLLDYYCNRVVWTVDFSRQPYRLLRLYGPRAPSAEKGSSAGHCIAIY